MASIDDVQDISPRVQYTAIAAQTAFTYPFPIFVDADIVVDIDGVLKVLTTDYTVSGAGNETGGTVTLVVAATGAEVVTIYRDISIARSTDFQQNGPWSSTSFNDELDKIVLILQELENKIGRSIRFPITGAITNAQAELAPISNFKNKFLHITSAGLLEAADVLGAVVTLSAEVIGALLYPQTTAESAAGVTPVNFRYEPGDVRRYGAVGNGSDDDITSLQNAINVWVKGVVTGNPDVDLPTGDYKITSGLVVEDSASQWVLRGEGRARSSSIQATTAVTGVMLSGKNLRECTIENIEFLGDSGTKPTHGIKLDRDSVTQTGNGGPGKIEYRGLLFRNVDTGVEIVNTGAGGNNDEMIWDRCIFGQGITKYGVQITGTNTTWNNILYCRFDTCGYADVSTIVAIGESRGGSFEAKGCKHVSGVLAYHIGDCRYAQISNVVSEQHDNLLWSSGPYLEATDISISGTDTFNSAAAALPAVASGDLIWTRGHTTSGNDGVYRVTGAPSTSAIQVTTIDGSAPSLTNDSAGATVQLAPTKLLAATEATTAEIVAAEVRTTDQYPIIWDGDSDEHTLYIRGKFSLANSGAIVCMGNATVTLGPGRYQVTELIVEDGVIEIQPGVTFSAGSITKTFLGTGRIINHGARGGQVDDQVTWNPADLVDGAQESKTVTVSGARVGDFVKVFPGVDVEELDYSAAVSANDTVEITLFNHTGSNVNLASSVWHVRVFPFN